MTETVESAAALGRAIEAGRLDPRALAERHLAVAASMVDGPQASFVATTAARAQREAAAAADRARRGVRRVPLDGVTVSWKDLFDLAGAPTRAGSRLTSAAPAARDAALAARGARAGLVAVGKTHLSELAFSGLGLNRVTATPPNAFDPERAPGGSSSGAAISLTAGAAALAIGTDTGGSVRIPAAWNGLFGLKPTHGWAPMDGVTPLSPSLDTAGPLALTLEDAALAYEALGGPRVRLGGVSPARVSLAAPDTVLLDGLSGAARTAFEAALDRLSAAGVRLERGAAPECAEALRLAAENGAVVNTEGYAMWSAAIEADPDAMDPRIRARFLSGLAFSAPQIETTRLAMPKLAASLWRRFERADALIAPTTPNRAPRLVEIEADDDAFVAENLAALRNTRLANLLGLCALSLPAGVDAEGAPLSVMVIGRPNTEALLLRIGDLVNNLLS